MIWIRRSVLWISALAVLAIAPALAAAETRAGGGGLRRPAQSVAEKPGVEPATLTFFNREIVEFRATVLGYTPAERAAAAERRLDEMVRRGEAGPVTVAPATEGAYQVAVGGKWVFFLSPADADQPAGQTAAQAAMEARKALSEALLAVEEQSTFGRFLRALTAASIATVLFILFLLLLRRLQRYLHFGLHSFLRAIARRSESVRAARPRLLMVIDKMVSIPFYVGAFALTYAWLIFVLEQFPYTRPWGESLGQVLVDIIDDVVTVFVANVPGLLTILAIVIVTRWLVRGSAIFFELVENRRIHIRWLHSDLAAPTRKLATAVLWVFAAVIAYPFIPFSESAAFRGISVLIGVMISLGGMGIVNQAMSGLTLMYARAFRPGEYVRIGEIEGTVTSLGVLSTRVRTVKFEEMNIPNSVVLSTATKNFSRQAETGPLILHTSVTIGYDAPWRQVHALLESAARRTAGLLREPSPFVLQTSLADFYVQYEINAVIERPHERIQVLSDLHRNIQDLFNEYGVQIMSPHFMANPPAPVVVPRGQWHVPPAPPEPRGGAETIAIRKADE